MASILDKYGIKEVADVTFYTIDKDTAEPKLPVLFLDTLKVSTIEQTAENVEARGGKGNVALVSWDYGKEINVTLEDALFSAKSMALMFGNGNAVSTSISLIRTVEWKAAATGDASTAKKPSTYKIGDKEYALPSDAKDYTEDASADDSSQAVTSYVGGKRYFSVFNVNVADAGVIEISASTFPGTYYVTGDTFARSAITGEDEFFQFIIPKAKVAAENTITLEAEGDPSVFNLSLRVLRPDDGVMMKLVKYEMPNS